MKSDRKRVLVISRSYHPAVDGPSVYIHQILRRVKDHDFTVFTSTSGSSEEGMRVERKSFRGSRHLIGLLYILYSIMFSLTKEFDCVVGNDFVGSVAAMFVSLINRKPLISVFHNIQFENVESHRILLPFRRLFLRMVFKRSWVIVSAPPRVKKDIQEDYGGHEEKVAVIPYGVNIPQFDKVERPEDKKVILFVGSLYGDKKGGRCLVRAFGEVRERVDSELWFVGPVMNERYHKKMEEIGRKFGVLKDIRFIGPVPHDSDPTNVFSYYDACDVFCLPSFARSETFGIPCIEASKMGKPIVATGLLEENGTIKDGETGLVVPMRDWKSLSGALIKLLKNKELRNRLGENGEEFAKKFDWNKSSKKFEKVLGEIK